MIFLDTDIISYLISGNRKVGEALTYAVQQGENIAVTSVNIYEVLKGFRYCNSQKREQEFLAFLCYADRYHLTEAAANIAAQVYADLRRFDKTIGDADILIASTVIANNGVLVTNNQKHYQHIKALKIENWLE